MYQSRITESLRVLYTCRKDRRMRYNGFPAAEKSVIAATDATDDGNFAHFPAAALPPCPLKDVP